MGKHNLDGVGVASGEGRQPHVEVVPGLIDAIEKVTHHSRISAVLRKDVDVGRISRDLNKEEKEYVSQTRIIIWISNIKLIMGDLQELSLLWYICVTLATSAGSPVLV